MKTDKKREGFLALCRQGSMILACGTTIWCLVTGVTFMDTIFRAIVVYLTMVIISYVVSNMIAMNIVTLEVLDVTDPPVDHRNESQK